MFQASGIVVEPGPPTKDPRLDPLDLRGRLGAVTVMVVDSDRRPVEKAEVYGEAMLVPCNETLSALEKPSL